MRLPRHVFYMVSLLTILRICFGFQPSLHQRAISYDKRTTSSVNISIILLEQLEIEHKSFHGWIEAWLDSNNSQTTCHQIEQEMQAYDDSISAWLASATSTDNPLSMASSKNSGLSVTSEMAENSGSISALPETTAMVTKASVTITSAAVGVSTPTHLSTVSASNTQKDSLLGKSLAVYYGQSNATAQVTLAQLCRDQNVDIVILAFLTTFFGPGEYPTVNFGAACNDEATSAAKEKNATGLLSCQKLARDITACQAAGKKVMLSLGGAESTTAFSSDAQATEFATTIWNLFGSGTSDQDLRPFGSVKVDGFDIGETLQLPQG